MVEDKTNVKVTVITPTLNSAPTLRQCIDSVRKQNYPNVEHIIIDGGSTDDTVQILRSEGVAFLSEADAGIYDAFNKGIMRATGEIIHILNSDDYYATESVISNIVSRMVKNNLDLCHARAVQIDAKGKRIWVIGTDATKAQLLRKMKTAHPSVFVKKTVYKKYGAFSVGFRVAGDHEFLLRVWNNIKIDFYPAELIFMRLGGASSSQVCLSYQESLAATVLHGQPVCRATVRYYWEVAKHSLVVCPLRWLGFTR